MQLQLDLQYSSLDSWGKNDLAGFLRYWPAELEVIEANKEFKRIEIPKPDDTVRIFNIPQGTTEEVHRVLQRRMLRNLNRDRIRRSVVESALKHRRARAFFMLDLKNAYGHVSSKMIGKSLESFTNAYVGHCALPDRTKRASMQLAKMLQSGEPNEIGLALAGLALTRHDGLPQGSPASPYLFDLVCFPLDVAMIEIFGYSFEGPYAYSRYSDNFIVSSVKGDIPAELRERAIQAVKDYGFPINRHKVHYFTGNARRPVITGITLTERKNYVRKAALSRKKIRRYRGFIGRAITDSSIRTESVRGVISWVVSVYGKDIPNQLRAPIAGFAAARNAEHLKVSKIPGVRTIGDIVKGG